MSTSDDHDVQEQPEQPTSISSGAGRSRGQFEPPTAKLDPKIREKIDLPGRGRFCVKKRPKSEIRQNLIQLNEIRPKPSQQRLPEEKEPQCQHRQPGGGAPEPTEPRGHSIPVSIDRQPRGYPRHPGALTCHLDTLKGVTRGQQSAQTQEVTRGSIQIRFLAITSPRRPAGEKEAYFVTPARPVSPNNFQTPIGASSQQWRPSPTKSSFTAFTLASRRGATTHGYQASISYLLTNSSTTYIHTSAYTV